VSDNVLTAEDYADAREAFQDAFTDTVVIQSYNSATSDAEGATTPTYTDQAPIRGLVTGLHYKDVQRAQGAGIEADVKLLLPALSAIKTKDRARVTHWETGTVRTLEVTGYAAPSREFVRGVLCKEYQ
jgi:hypothetical protein